MFVIYILKLYPFQFLKYRDEFQGLIQVRQTSGAHLYAQLSVYSLFWDGLI